MDNLYVFTYGCGDEQPFVGGWTEVVAPDEETAIRIFEAFHPPVHGNLIPCSSIYTLDEFETTKMAGPKGNLGARCHENIIVLRTLYGEEAYVDAD